MERLLILFSITRLLSSNFVSPEKFSGGNNWLSVIGATIILWGMTFIIAYGVEQAGWVTVVGTVVRMAVIALIIVALAIHFKWVTFTTNFSASQSIPALHDQALGSVPHQVLKTMTVTLWAFGGIEGAVVLSDRAKSQLEVKRATAIGYFMCLALYIIVSLLPLGLLSYGEIARMVSPSTAQLLTLAMHCSAGRLIIAAGLIVSVLSCWLSWTMMLAEMPFAAAKDGAFPKIFAKENKKHVPVFSLFAATVVMQLIILLSHFASNAFQMAYTIVATMTVPPYFISALYLIKLSIKQANYPGQKGRISALVTGILAALFTLIMGISAGINYVTIAFIAYMIGIPLFIKARKEQAPGEPIFARYEKWFAVAIVVVAIGGVILLLK